WGGLLRGAPVGGRSRGRHDDSRERDKDEDGEHGSLMHWNLLDSGGIACPQGHREPACIPGSPDEICLPGAGGRSIVNLTGCSCWRGLRTEAPPCRVRFLYGTSRPSTTSWIAPADRPTESTVSLPARVLISSRSFAASAYRIPILGSSPFAVTSVASPLTLIVSSLLVALTTTRSGWPSPVAPPRVAARSTLTALTSVPLRSLTVTRSARPRALKSTRSTPLVSMVMVPTSRVNVRRLPFSHSPIFSAMLAPL